ncbi:unnamed protein product [Prorocentrum cordatum]|uniref:Ion transport domain-containing protein n=1 Tax=Prorocentrum cordatum TaxID=2364126 RepID=A0ABN9PL06_9DINO|nr:unnamed protein product [Polarella glacialis]
MLDPELEFLEQAPPCPSTPDAGFRELVDRLVDQHEAGMAALREENRSLREAVAELRGGERPTAGLLAGPCSDVDQLAAARAALGPAPAAPELPAWPCAWLPHGVEQPPAAAGSAVAPALRGSLHSVATAPWVLTPTVAEDLKRESFKRESSLLSVSDADGGGGSRVSVAGTVFRIPASEVTRFLHMFNIDMWNTDNATICASDLFEVLEQRGLRGLSMERVSCVMRRLVETNEIRLSRQSPTATAQTRCTDDTCQRLGPPNDDSFQVPFRHFMGIIFSKDIARGLSSDDAQDAKRWQQCLMTQTIEEVIDRLAYSGSPPSLHALETTWSAREKQKQRLVRSQRTGVAMLLLNYVVAITVVTSVVSMALSMDYCYNCEIWFYHLEILAATVFIIELLAKLSVYGRKEFLFGLDWRWNWCDICVTCVQLLEVGAGILVRLESVEVDQMLSVGSVVIAMRALRLLRFARLLKMLRSPLLKELANMFQGFLLGLPALLWVFVLICMVVWVIGAGFRSVIGPELGQESLLDKCGFDGDSMPQHENASVINEFPECGNRAKLYADEYCLTVAKCSFTIFRCMIGDCSSKGGQSLPAHLSEGYKVRFDVVYVLGMIVLIFGLFNVIQLVCRVDNERPRR